MHIYSADCDCAVCSMERFDDHLDDALAESNMVPEETELEEVPCTRCGIPHVYTYKWVYPMCLDCEKDMVPVR